jgi:UDP-N-acetylmuramoylalanine--D-glutamate ligase
MASGIVSRVLELREGTIKGEHDGILQGRLSIGLKFVANISGIRFINDSKATNVNSTWYALESMSAGVVLILGRC